MWPWSRAIAIIDMNAFFASVEQLDTPTLRGKPVVILPNAYSKVIIASSYEAKSLGIHTGCNTYEAFKKSEEICCVVARKERYMEISRRIMSSLQEHVTHNMEIFSIDEAFLDVTVLQRCFTSPEALAIYIQKVVIRASGLPVSVGLSADRTTAKWLCKQYRPHGIGIMDPIQASKLLAHLTVDHLCGISTGIKRYLARYKVVTCADMARLPVAILSRRFGVLGQRLWLMSQGRDPEGIRKHLGHKSMGHSKIIPAHMRQTSEIQAWCLKLAYQLAERMHALGMHCRYLIVAIVYTQGQRFKQKIKIHNVDPHAWYKNIQAIIQASPIQKDIYWIGIYAYKLHKGLIQDIWSKEDQTSCMQVVSRIKQRFGKHAIQPLSFLEWEHKHWSPGISPSWRP